MATLSLLAKTATAAVGRTEGAASVSAGGGARYVVPLELPPGVNGLTPELALSYSHEADNGLVGIGFRITGLSEIARCSKSIALDGGGAPISLTAGDAYCLDGNRLRLTSGTDGQASSTYQTAVETYSRATVTAANTHGPSSWEVRRKDGLIYQYGATNDSRIETLGTAAVRAWALNKITDRSGNAIELVYEKDASGAFRPFEIRYGRNEEAGTSHTTQVVFVYEPGLRPDPIYAFQSAPGTRTAGPIHEYKRLDRVDVVDIATSTTVRTYEVTYDPVGGAGNRSRLSSIQESRGSDTLLPTTVTWTTGTPGWSSSEVATDVSSYGIQRGDFNGDGRTDVLFSSSASSGTGTWHYMLGTETGLGPAVDTTIQNHNFASAQLIEWNGDGRLDLLVPCNGTNTWCVMVATGSGFLPLSNTGVSSAGLQLVNDFNCDGLDDLVRIDKSTLPNRLFTRARSAGGFAAETLAWTSPIPIFKIDNFGPTLMARERGSQRTLDFNGDRCGDFLLATYDDDPEPGTRVLYSLTAFLGSTGGIIEVARALGEQNTPVTLVAAGDFNGDGHTDFLRSSGTTSFIAFMGSGGLFSGPVQGPARADYWDEAMFVGDYDGDGLDDIGMFNTRTNTWHISRSTGNAFAALFNTGMPIASAIRPADLNGDGNVDLVGALLSNRIRYRLHNASLPDFVDRITDGFEMYVDFDYVRLNHSGGVYTRGSGAVFPTLDHDGPAYVVSRMTSTTGTGSTYEITYTYEGARQHVQGHGFLGFAKRTQTDSRNGLRTEETYMQDVSRWEALGASSTVQVRQSDGRLMADTTLTWGVLPAGSGTTERRFPYITSQVARRYETGGTLNGELITTTTTTTEGIDAVSGFVYDARTVVQEASLANGLQPGGTYEQRIYHPPGMLRHDTAGWCIGRPSETQQTNRHAQSGGTAITRTTQRTWDMSRCRVSNDVAEPGHTTREVVLEIGYDTFGNVVTRNVIGRNPDGTRMDPRSSAAYWGANGRFLRWTTDPLGQRTTYGWDEKLGLRTSLTDPNQLQTSWAYDNFGRLTRETRPDGTATTLRYEDCAANGCLNANNKLIIKEARLDTGGVSVREDWMYLDRFDRLLATRPTLLTGGLSRVERRYDAFGRLSQQSAPCAWDNCSYFWTDYAYDALNRVTRVSRPTSEAISTPLSTYFYHEGLRTRRVDPQNKQSAQIRNVAGQILRLTDHDGYYIQYEYDAFANPLRVTDSTGASLQTDVIDVRGLRTASTVTGAGTRSYSYNSLGELRSEQDAGSRITTFNYDPLGRLTTRSDAQGTTTLAWGISESARNIGRLRSKTGPTGVSETYAYDASGRLQLTTIDLQADGTYLIERSYNALGMLDRLTYPTSTSAYRLALKYEYANAQLQRIRDANAPGTVFWQADAVNPRGQITQEALGNGLVTARGFNSISGYPGYIRTGLGGGNATQNLSYLWDGADNLIQRQDGNQGLTEDFYYDNLHRIDYSRLNGTTNLNLDYDARGRITNKLDDADAAPEGGSATWLDNGLPNALSASLPQGSGSSQFFYDADQQRYKQTTSQGSSTETVLYVGGLLERVTVGSTTTFRHYISAPTGLVAIYARSSNGTDTMYYTLRDHLGSIDKITNAAGSITVALSYSAYGQRRSASWAGAPTAGDWASINAITHRGFTGHEHLDSVGLIHMNGRVYQPSLARFLSSDPFVDALQGTQAFDRYAYLGNGPLSGTDPSGFMEEIIVAATRQRSSTWNPVFFLGNRGFLMQRAGGRTIVRPREPPPPTITQFDPSSVPAPGIDMKAVLKSICDAEVDRDFASPESKLHDDLDTVGNALVGGEFATEAMAASFSARAAARMPRAVGGRAMIAYPIAGQLATPSLAGWQHFNRTNARFLRGSGAGFGVAGTLGDSFAAFDSFESGDNFQGGLDTMSAVGGAVSFVSGPYGASLWLGAKLAKPIMKNTAKMQCRGTMSPGPITPRL